MAQTSTSRHAPRRPRAGLFAMIAGILGALACAALILVTFTGRDAVQQRVDALGDGAVAALDAAVGVSEEALAGLAAGAQEAAELREAAEGLRVAPTIEQIALNALLEQASPLTDGYADVRGRYLVLREKTSALVDTVTRIERLIPGLDLPDGPVELLAGMDARLVAADGAVADVSRAVARRTESTETVTAIAEGAGRLEDGFRASMDLAQGVQDGLLAMQADVEGLADRTESIIGLASWVLVAFLGWVALLNVALWALGRRWRAA